jgi:hypothetical protein
MVPVEVPGRSQFQVFPGRDERVVRVVRKVVRGLCHYHGLLTAVEECRVVADVLTVPIPPQFFALMEHHHREADICQYRYHLVNDAGIHSAWLLTFFERPTFLVTVSAEGT